MWTSACRRCSTLSSKQSPGTRSADLCRIRLLRVAIRTTGDEQKSRPTLAMRGDNLIADFSDDVIPSQIGRNH